MDHVDVDDGRLLPYQTFKIEQEESEILLEMSDRETNNDNQENRGDNKGDKQENSKQDNSDSEKYGWL